MDGASLARIRWRLHGAWMWPSFIVLTILDAFMGQQWPPSGEAQSAGSATMVALFLNLIGIIVLSWPLSLVIRRLRPDVPKLIARDYGGTVVIVSITLILLVLGLLHHSSITANRRARTEAIARAQAYIGDHAPAEFRRNVAHVSTYEIQAGSIYRECVPSIVRPRRRTYCVIVRPSAPFATSVTFAGHESNANLSRGAW